jgi:thiamine biosynthesis lipoprotein
MMSFSPVSRARPLLGTLVAVRVEGLPEPDAHAAIEDALDDIAEIDRLMSFHRPDNDLGRLNLAAADGPVTVDPRTVEVLACALELARRSRGVFDVTVAVEQVARGVLPWPCAGRAPAPAAKARWRDIEIVGPDRVRFRRPLWIDLGGIAKGYAVDCAVERLRRLPGMQCVVNAGGDIRVFGSRSARIGLKAVTPGCQVLPVVELENGSVASSSGRGQAIAPHLHGRTRRPVGQDCFVAVAAERCMIADAMTKCVLAMGESARPLLTHYSASAFVQGGRGDWRRLGAAA